MSSSAVLRRPLLGALAAIVAMLCLVSSAAAWDFRKQASPDSVGAERNQVDLEAVTGEREQHVLAVARSLRPTDRQRVRGYERIRTGRELLSVSEDVKVLALFARGVRAMSPEKRERLQTLLGKAIVATELADNA